MDFKFILMGIGKSIRQAIYDRDGNQCLRCGACENLSIDHILPISKHGKSNAENYQTLCKTCNENKANNFIDYRRIPYTEKWLHNNVNINPVKDKSVRVRKRNKKEIQLPVVKQNKRNNYIPSLINPNPVNFHEDFVYFGITYD